jgi:F-type H+-transporting ATPase subunit gamma
LTFRGVDVAESFTGFSDRPAYADARRIATRLMAAYTDGELDQVEIFYNGYISPLSQVMRRETLLPLQRASVFDENADSDADSGVGDEHAPRGSVEYEPDPEVILERLVPDYVEISIYRALLESTASEHGARMTAMRNASDNASNLIDDYTLQMNRARQAEITQEIAEVVAGAEGLG